MGIWTHVTRNLEVATFMSTIIASIPASELTERSLALLFRSCSISILGELPYNRQ